MVILKAKLLALKKAEEKAQLDELRGDVAGVVGRPDAQLRAATPTRWSRTCAPSYEVGNPQAVFDGDIDGFLEAGIRWRRGAEKAAANSTTCCEPRGHEARSLAGSGTTRSTRRWTSSRPTATS